VAAALDRDGLDLVDGDIVVIASKIASKSEGRRAADLPPSARAHELAGVTGFPAPEVELILSETRAVLRAAPGVLVVETHHGYICANAGVDRSNTGAPSGALLLPADADATAARVRDQLATRYGAACAVLVSDTFGRPFRNGLVNVALGVAGMAAIRDYRGQVDPAGRVLKGTELAVADELCAAAELVMNKLDRVPAALVRGYRHVPGAGRGADLLRDPATDHFR
ncbi:MAG: coenzyme F420-0:L-glutamate ligase / coenzyme F420:gamma-L-glutamate ligase, partial [Chloroflexota bacterium]|nr:coenzyme F420-0:L-glutamate ligase / coenzyme F420:gamma-L-glutamate ligase [Chloroflexota bacterium]